MASIQPWSGAPRMRNPITPTTKMASTISAAVATRRWMDLSSPSSRALTRCSLVRGTLRALEQEGAVFPARALFVADGELAALVRRGAGVAAVLRQRVEVQVEARAALVVQQALFGVLEHPLHHLHQGGLRIEPLSHVLHREERAAHHDVRLTASRRSGGANGVVGVFARPDDRRVTDAPRNLPRQAARRGTGTHVAGGVHGVHVD